LTPLHLATREGHYEIAKLLIDSGADVNFKDAKVLLNLNKEFHFILLFRKII